MFLTKLRDMVFVPDANETPAPQAAQPAAQAPPVAQSTAINHVDLATTESVLDVAGLMNIIQGVINDEPQYAKFAKFQAASAALEKVILVEGTRMQAAQATTGLTREELLNSLNAHANILASEAQNFTDTYVAASEAQVQGLNADADDLAAEIQVLTTRLAELSTKREERIAEATAKSTEIAKAKIDFESVTRTIANRHGDISTKLQQYLGA